LHPARVGGTEHPRPGGDVQRVVAGAEAEVREREQARDVRVVEEQRVSQPVDLVGVDASDDGVLGNARVDLRGKGAGFVCQASSPSISASCSSETAANAFAGTW
jgi:hypothetical protein